MPAIPESRANELADHIVGTADDTSNPTDAYVALVDSAGNELNHAGYERQLVTFDAASGRQAPSNIELEFGPAEEDWVEIHGVAVYDAATGGQIHLEGDIATPQTVNDTQRLIIEVGDLTFTVDPV